MILSWLPYFILGLIGILYHVWSKPNAGPLLEQLKTRSTALSILAYCVLVFLWYDGSLTIISVQPEPSGLAFVLGYFSQSILGHVIKQVGNKLKGGKDGTP